MSMSWVAPVSSIYLSLAFGIDDYPRQCSMYSSMIFMMNIGVLIVQVLIELFVLITFLHSFSISVSSFTAPKIRFFPMIPMSNLTLVL